jgi:hypothetical protein
MCNFLLATGWRSATENPGSCLTILVAAAAAIWINNLKKDCERAILRKVIRKTATEDSERVTSGFVVMMDTFLWFTHGLSSYCTRGRGQWATPDW